MTTISLEGISSIANEERTLAHLNVNYNNNEYDWKIYIPQNTTNLSEFLNDANTITKIENQIQAKEDEWEALIPKTREIDDLFGETITVEIQKDEIVKPDIPDNYAKRRNEYPSLTEQLAALWKGTSSPDFENIKNKITEVKEKYPIDVSETFVPLTVTPFQAKSALLLEGLLPSIESYLESAEPIVKLAWEEASEFRRYSPAILSIAESLNWTEEQLDMLFELANSIEV